MRSLAHVLAFCLFIGTALAQKPALELSEPGWDFGRRIQGAVDARVITVKNTSTRTIKAKVTKTCGCMEVREKKLEIAPGASAELHLGLDTKRGEGAIKKFVLLETDDPNQRLYSLPMTGFIETVWNLDRKDINLDNFQRKDGVITSFEINIRKGHDTKITGMKSHTGSFAMTTVPLETKDGSRRYRVDLSLAGKIETGYFEDVILVMADDKDIPQRMIRIAGKVMTSTTVTPNSLAFGLLKPGTPKTLTLKVTSTHGNQMQVLGVDCEHAMISTSFREVEKGKVWEVKVTANPEAGTRDLRGILRIRIEEPGQVIQKVNFYGRILLP
jgi:uncharacterized protein DUF1573